MIRIKTITFESIETTSKDDKDRQFLLGEIKTFFEGNFGGDHVQGVISKYPPEAAAHLRNLKEHLEYYLNQNICLKS